MSDLSKKELFNNIKSAATEAVSWVQSVKDKNVVEFVNQNNLQIELYDLINDAKNASEVLSSSSSLGVFGESQVGKSFLISNLVSPNCEDITAELDGKLICFSDHLNPNHGGKNVESSGIVTRFSKNVGKVPAGYPFKLKLFDEIDIVKILAYGFFKNVTTSPDIQDNIDEFFKSKDKIDSFFGKELASEKYKISDKDSCYIKGSAIVSLARYIRGIASGQLQTFKPQDLFWSKAIDIIDKLNFEGRALIYKKIWGNTKIFNYFLDHIGQAIQILGGAHEAYAPISCCSIDNGNGLKRRPEGTLLDIAVLKKLVDLKNISSNGEPKFVDGNEIEIALDCDGTKIVKLPFPVLAIVTRELVFPLQKESNCGNLDILDFPGARTAENFHYETVNSFEGKLEDITDLLRRGKVSYLFDSYSQKHEIDVLILCIRSDGDQSNVSKDLLDPLDKWVENNIGATPEQRSKFGYIPLIGAFTKFDMAINGAGNFDKTAAANSVASTFQVALERLKKSPWLTDWSNGKCFDRFFCVRKINLKDESEKLFEIESNGDSIVEKNLRSDEKTNNIIKVYKANICKNEEAKHLYGYEKDWAQTLDEVLKPNDGGIKYLLKYIQDNFADYDRNKQKVNDDVLEKTNEIKRKLASLTTQWGQREKIAQQRKNGEKIIAELRQCEILSGTLADIRHFIEIDADEAIADYQTYHTDGVRDNAYRFAKALTKFHYEKLDQISKGSCFDFMFMNLCRSYDENKQKSIASLPLEMQKKEYSFFLEDNATTNETSVITDGKRLKEKFQKLLVDYTSELKKVYKNLEVEQAVVNKLLKNEKSNVDNFLPQGQTERALNIISDFNTYLTVGTCDSDIARFDDNFNYEENRNNKTERPLFHEITAFVKNEIKVRQDNEDGISEVTDTTFNMYRIPDFNIYDQHEGNRSTTSASIVDKFDKHYYQDYFSVLLNLMVSKNVTGQSLYNLTKDEDSDLCNILDELNVTKE